MNDKTLTVICIIEEGALLSCPVYEEHKNGRNWFATIKLDPLAPGGVFRTSHDKTNGKSFYRVANVAAGDAVEFGADKYSGTGLCAPSRWYGVVDSITNRALVMTKCETAREAIALADARAAAVRRDDLIDARTHTLRAQVRNAFEEFGEVAIVEWLAEFVREDAASFARYGDTDSADEDANIAALLDTCRKRLVSAKARHAERKEVVEQ